MKTISTLRSLSSRRPYLSLTLSHAGSDSRHFPLVSNFRRFKQLIRHSRHILPRWSSYFFTVGLNGMRSWPTSWVSPSWKALWLMRRPMHCTMCPFATGRHYHSFRVASHVCIFYMYRHGDGTNQFHCFFSLASQIFSFLSYQYKGHMVRRRIDRASSNHPSHPCSNNFGFYPIYFHLYRL